MATVHIPTGVRQAPPLQPQPQPIVEKVEKEIVVDPQPAPQPIAEAPITEKPKKPKKTK